VIVTKGLLLYPGDILHQSVMLQVFVVPRSLSSQIYFSPVQKNTFWLIKPIGLGDAA